MLITETDHSRAEQHTAAPYDTSADKETSTVSLNDTQPHQPAPASASTDGEIGTLDTAPSRPLSPVPGVSFQPQRPAGGRWRAQWQENGSRRNETFSIVTYGTMEKAQALAEAKVLALVKEGKGSSYQKAYFAAQLQQLDPADPAK